MATKVTVTPEDDLNGGPADETVWFGLDGTEYEIDLNKKNARAFRRQLAPFIEHARKAGQGQRRRAAYQAGVPVALAGSITPEAVRHPNRRAVDMTTHRPAEVHDAASELGAQKVISGAGEPGADRIPPEDQALR
jgi:hypothetical protein